jgi:hypothetical protein
LVTLENCMGKTGFAVVTLAHQFSIIAKTLDILSCFDIGNEILLRLFFKLF